MSVRARLESNTYRMCPQTFRHTRFGAELTGPCERPGSLQPKGRYRRHQYCTVCSSRNASAASP